MLNMHEISDPRMRVIVALDCDKQTALNLAKQLQGQAAWLKVGMTLYYAEGPSIVYKLKDMGFKIFLDLKLHDIPHQVKGAAYAIAALGIDMFTIHASGGSEMMSAAYKGAVEAVSRMGTDVPVSLAITVLSSIDNAGLSKLGIANSMDEQVKLLAISAMKSGVSGVVSSPKEAKLLRALLGENAYIVTPGVRPYGSATADQKRIATPASAIQDGASHIVVGRPITEAPDPLSAFCSVVDEIAAI